MFDVIIDSNLIVNVCIHVTILFFLLYFLFFTIISKKSQEALNNSIDMVNNNIPSILDSIKKDYNKYINWKKIKEECQTISDNVDLNIDKNIEDNNTKYKNIGIYIGLSLILFTILVYIYYQFYKKEHVDIMNILKENILTFLLIGIIEFIFFTKTASQYIPVYPTSVSTIVLDRTILDLKNI